MQTLIAYRQFEKLHVWSRDLDGVLWSHPMNGSHLSGVAFSADGSMIATATSYGPSPIVLWKAQTGEKIAEIKGHRSWVSGIRFWPDNSKLVASGADQLVHLWDIRDVNSIKSIRKLAGQTTEVWGVEIAPDKNMVCSIGKNGTLTAWDLKQERVPKFPRSVDRQRPGPACSQSPPRQRK